MIDEQDVPPEEGPFDFIPGLVLIVCILGLGAAIVASLMN